MSQLFERIVVHNLITVSSEKFFAKAYASFWKVVIRSGFSINLQSASLKAGHYYLELDIRSAHVLL